MQEQGNLKKKERGIALGFCFVLFCFGLVWFFFFFFFFCCCCCWVFLFVCLFFCFFKKGRRFAGNDFTQNLWCSLSQFGIARSAQQIMYKWYDERPAFEHGFKQIFAPLSSQ